MVAFTLMDIQMQFSRILYICKKQISKRLKLSAFEFQVGKDLEARRSQLREVKEFHRNEEARLTQVITLDSNVPLLAWMPYTVF